MNYPLISEYIESIMSAEDNFDQLSSLCPVHDSYGNPVMSSGNFAVVFKMEDLDTGKFYAVKCFIKDQEGRNESYAMIADELKNVNSPYILPIKFLENELFVDTSQSDETEFPVLVMDWVEGKTLDAYLRENLDNKYRLQVLSYRFCQMSAWLMSQPFAHGDLKPDNILVQENGSLVLVDYDGFYVPTMAGMEARELGSPDFRHPLRTPKDFNEHLDDFSIATIALSLKAISLDGQLYHTHAASDRLLLSASDYLDIGNSVAMQKIMQLASDTELSALLSTFYMASALKVLDKSHIKVFEIEMPAIILGEGKTILTQEDVKQANEKYGELVNVVIAGSVTGIGEFAFSGCSGLTSLIIPDSVTSIGSSAFRRCSGLTSLTIPDSVTSIGSSAFRGCSGLTSLTIPDSVTSIGSDAFLGCSGLTSLIIPDSVTSIGSSAFCGCSGLTSLIIPDSVTSIGSYAFYFCSGLTEVNISDLSAWCKIDFGSYDSNPLYYAKKLKLNGTEIKDLVIPNDISKIKKYTFCNCDGLTSVTIHNSVTSICDRAFEGCSGLTSITILGSVTSIGSYAFKGCSGLTSIVVDRRNKKYDSRGNSNAIIETDTNTLIVGCKKTIIPNSVTSIGFDAFWGCRGLTSLTIPDSVTSIGSSAFCGCRGLTSLIIPGSVTEIGTYAFCGCRGLTSLIIPDSVTSIDSSAFRDCRGLTSIVVDGRNKKYDSRENSNAIIETDTNTLIVGCKKTIIPNSVTSIGSYAFEECTGLTSLIIPNSVTSIGSYAFSGCSGLTSIVVDGRNKKYDSRENSNAIIETDTNTLIVGCKKTIIPYSVTSIGSSAFRDCSGLTSITIPNSVVKIGERAFSGCTGLTEITIPNSVTEIGEGVFDRCVNLEEIIISKGYRQKFKKMLREDLYQKLVEQ